MSIDFEALRPQLEELCRRYKVAELSVFGSVARGEDHGTSDVDFLYVRGPGSPLGLEFFGLQEELERLLHRDVDLVPKEGLHWVIRDRVLADARVLYAA
ncbi:MAG: nucleotidyltransferase family protein [Actinomycetota bacterium]|nr:nucleotidyltransferase family protein [Actinomycetota bacterium]